MKTHKYIEIKQHAPKQPMSNRKIKQNIKKTLKQETMETQHKKTYMM
jgi:hypothetical protein